MSRHSLFSCFTARGSFILTAALGLFCGLAVAQSASPSQTPASGATATLSASPLDTDDRRFIENAAQGGMAEVALGKVAQQRGAHAQVKSFGERMTQDHGRVNEDLKRVASAKGVQLPDALSHAQQRDLDRMSKLSGLEFDRAYTKQMLDDHKKDVEAFEKASRTAKDAGVKEFASQALPMLQSHLQMAQTAYDEVRGSKNVPMKPARGASR